MECETYLLTRKLLRKYVISQAVKGHSLWPKVLEKTVNNKDQIKIFRDLQTLGTGPLQCMSTPHISTIHIKTENSPISQFINNFILLNNDIR